MQEKIRPIVIQAAKDHIIDTRFLLSLVELESSWNPYAMKYEPGYIWLYQVSEMQKFCKCSRDTMEMMQRTSWGIGQIMGAVAYEHGYRGWCGKLLIPEINLKYVCKHINSLLKKYDQITFDTPLDLYAAYNAGSVRKVEGRYVNAGAVTAFSKIYNSSN